MIKKLKFDDIEEARLFAKKIGEDKCDFFIEVDVDIEKEILDIKTNIGSALAVVRNNGKDSSYKKSLMAVKKRIDFLFEI